MDYLSIKYKGERTHQTLVGIILATGRWVTAPLLSVGYGTLLDNVSVIHVNTPKDVDMCLMS